MYRYDYRRNPTARQHSSASVTAILRELDNYGINRYMAEYRAIKTCIKDLLKLGQEGGGVTVTFFTGSGDGELKVEVNRRDDQFRVIFNGLEIMRVPYI